MPSFKKTIAVGAKKKYWTCKISALQVEYFTRLLKFLVIRMGHPLFAYCLLNTLNDKCISRNCNKCLERLFYCIIGESCDFLHQTFFKAEAQRRAAQQTEWNVLHKTWRHAKEVSIDCNIYGYRAVTRIKAVSPRDMTLPMPASAVSQEPSGDIICHHSFLH